MGVILGILQGADGAPCVESPDSPSIDIGEPECLLSTDTDNPPSSENFQNIRSVRTVEVKRTFTCFKKDFQAVRNWLASLDGGHLQYNAGLHGKAVIAGKFRLVGGISMNPTSATLGTVEATWRGYVLDCNIDLAESIRFRKDSDTQWSILCGETVVLTATSKTPGDGTGLLVVPGEIVTWANLPDDVKANAQEYDLVSSRFPTTPEECKAAIEGGSWKGMVVVDRGSEGGHSWTTWQEKSITFPSENFAYLTKWRAIRLKCNGEHVLTWWVQVSPYANSIDPSKGIRVFPVYYAQTLEEVTSGNGAIHGPVDIADRTSGLCATNFHKVDVVAKYKGDDGPDAWAFHPDITVYSKKEEAESILDQFPNSIYPYYIGGGRWLVHQEEVSGAPDWYSAFGTRKPIQSSSDGNYWAFPAFPGEQSPSIRFRTPTDVFVKQVTVSPSGQVTIYTIHVSYASQDPIASYSPYAGEVFYGRVNRIENGYEFSRWNKEWPQTTPPLGERPVTYGEMVELYGAQEADFIFRQIHNMYPSWAGQTRSARAIGDAEESSSESDFSSIYLSPRAFMALMESKINEYLIELGYISSADDENAFHYDISWTSKDVMQMTEGDDLPEGAGNPVYIDEEALNSDAGFEPSEVIESGRPANLKTVTLDMITTNTANEASLSEKGVYNIGVWTKVVETPGEDPQTKTVTYAGLFRRAMREFVPGISDADASPSAYGFYVALTYLRYKDYPNCKPFPIARYGLIGYICAPDAAMTGDTTTADPDPGASIIKLFWREDDKSVVLLANNAYGKNPLMTFQKAEESNSAS